MKKIVCTLLAIVLALSLCACGSSKAASGYEMPVPAAYSEEAYSYDYEAASGLASLSGKNAAVSAMEEAAPEPSSDGGTDAPEVDPEKIIYTGDVTLETLDFDKTVEGISSLIEDYGAYLESSSVSGANLSSIQSGKTSLRHASYTIRVPQARFSDMMNSLSSIGNVPNSNIYTENISSQYYDTQARLTSYTAQETRLLELLDKAQNVSDIIEIESELTEVRYKIENLQTMLRRWDNSVSYSTIYLSVSEVSEYTAPSKTSYGARLARALSNGIDSLGDFVIGLVEALPILILVVLIALAVLKLVKAIVAKSKKRKAEKAELKKAEIEAEKKTSAKAKAVPLKEDDKNRTSI